MLDQLNIVATKILLVLSISTIIVAQLSTSPMAKPGCQSQCGNVSFAYPFGMDSPECFYNEWFQIHCRSHKPYLRINQGGVEVSEVLSTYYIRSNYHSQTLEIRSNPSNIRVCEDTSKLLGANLTGTPFYYSVYNKFMLVGSGVAKLLSTTTNGTNVTEGGCTSVSVGGSAIDCFGVNCCQDKCIAMYRTPLNLDYSNSVVGKNNCASAFMAGKGWYPENASLLSDPNADLVNISVPFLLDWIITNSTPGDEFENNKYCRAHISEDAREWICHCPCGYGGNPYIVDGCQVLPGNVSDCSFPHFSEPSKPFVERNLKFMIIGGIFLLISVLAGLSYLLYKLIRKRMNRKLKEKRFKRNGGPLLQKYLSSNKNIMEKVRLFTGKDLNKATDQFNENRVLGRGGQGTVYKGMLQDGQIVAIKKSKLLANANQVEEFINEIIILSQINHKNVVKLLGCCLEMDVPLLVYEFIPNGTLYSLIHSENTDFPLSWEVRLRISLEVAEALAYLHSASSIPVYHRDIKSNNILLDEKFKAKVADFGTSRHIGVDQTHLTTLVKGTFGYLDPEYFQSSKFTEKSDVYSFGVVVVELLTGLKPICFSEEEESHLNLATRFLLAIEENCVDSILDPQVKETPNEDEVEAIIRLAQRCLNVNGRNRPSMKEITMVLQSIKKTQIPSTMPENSYWKGEVIVNELMTSMEIMTSMDIVTSSSDVSPLMSSSF